MILSFLLVLFCLAISAYFSSCETAISVSSKAKLHHLTVQGSRKAGLAEDLKANIGEVINTILACNTALNAVATSLAASLFLTTLGQEGIAYASLVMTILILLYAEVLPKMLAIWAPETLIVKSASLLKWIVFIVRPISKSASWIASKTLALMGIHLKSEDPNVAAVEELRGVIDLHKGADQDGVQERAMLKSILDLRFVQIGEIMVHRKNLTMLNADDPIESIIDQVSSSPFSRIPLWQGSLDNVVGIVNVKVLLRAVRSSPIQDLDIRKLSHTPWFIPESTDLLEQLQEFRKRKEHFALVVDEYGALLGAVTLEDILEEIVGNIDDEHDISVNGIRVQPDNSIIVDGSVTIRDLNRQFDWQLPDDSAATIAGLLINTIRMLPNVGQVFILYGFRFAVLKKQRNQITQIQMTKIAEDYPERK